MSSVQSQAEVHATFRLRVGRKRAQPGGPRNPARRERVGVPDTAECDCDDRIAEEGRLVCPCEVTKRRSDNGTCWPQALPSSGFARNSVAPGRS
jgi:hypothetical protein